MNRNGTGITYPAPGSYPKPHYGPSGHSHILCFQRTGILSRLCKKRGQQRNLPHLAGSCLAGKYLCNYHFRVEQGLYGVVPEYTVVQGCKALTLNELIIKMTGEICLFRRISVIIDRTSHNSKKLTQNSHVSYLSG